MGESLRLRSESKMACDAYRRGSQHQPAVRRQRHGCVAPPGLANTEGGPAWLRSRILDVVGAATESLGFSPGVRLDGPIDSAVPDSIAEHVIAVLREALSNVARHARASQADIVVQVDSHVTLTVTDDGVGLPEQGRRSGLRNLAERAESLGGSFEAARRPEGGTMLRWQVPLPRE